MLSKDVVITMKTETYSRTESGKSWKAKPDMLESEKLGRDQYEKMTAPETQSFFRSLGGYEQAIHGYTEHGYLIIELNSQDPQPRTVKKLRHFSFS